MPSRCFWVFALIPLFFVIWVAKPVDSAARNKVQPVTVEQFEQIINAKGSRYVIVFMAAWCTPCIDELPDIQAVYKRYQSQGLNLVGASLDIGGPEAIQPLVDAHKVRFPVYWIGEKAIETFDIKGIPLILFVQDGVILQHIEGKRPPKDLDRLIKAFLQPSPP